MTHLNVVEISTVGIEKYTFSEVHYKKIRDLCGVYAHLPDTSNTTNFEFEGRGNQTVAYKFPIEKIQPIINYCNQYSLPFIILIDRFYTETQQCMYIYTPDRNMYNRDVQITNDNQMYTIIKTSDTQFIPPDQRDILHGL